MKAILINPYVPLEVVYGKTFAKAGAVLPPLGILYLASYLRTKNKHSVEILDANVLQKGCPETAEYVLKGAFSCAGFSATTLAYPYAVAIARHIKQHNPHIKLAIGGAHAQGNPRGIISDNPGLFDFVCYGEGEYAFEGLLDYLDGKSLKDELSGWAYLDNGEVIKTRPAVIPDNLDLFGHPSELIPEEYIPSYHEKVLAYKYLPTLTVVTSRGCPFQCTFCSTPRKFTGLYNKKMRFHSANWICRELEMLNKKYGVREVLFADDTFNLKKDRVMEICDSLIRKGIKITWTCNFEANIADIEMLRKMKQAGCWGIMIGGESGSDKMLRFIKKGVTSRQLLQVAKIADSLGIVSRVSFIIGMPRDTKETIEETINFAARSQFHFPYFQLYVPLPGTEMYSQLREYGQIVEADTKERSAGMVNYVPLGLSEQYLLDAFKRAHKRAYLRWGMVKNHLKFMRSFSDFRRYFKGLRLLFLRG